MLIGSSGCYWVPVSIGNTSVQLKLLSGAHWMDIGMETSTKQILILFCPITNIFIGRQIMIVSLSFSLFLVCCLFSIGWQGVLWEYVTSNGSTVDYSTGHILCGVPGTDGHNSTWFLSTHKIRSVDQSEIMITCARYGIVQELTNPEKAFIYLQGPLQSSK